MSESNLSSDDAVKMADALGAIVKHAGDSSEAKQAASNIGKAAVTITEALNNCLLPIAAVNFAFRKAKTYFDNQFQADLQAATAGIPEESLIEPKAFVAAPVLQGLAFAHEEPSLKSLYLALLATAMDQRNESKCHPAFVEIIKQLSPEEARMMRSFIDARGNRAVVRLSYHVPEREGMMILFEHIVSHFDRRSGEEIANPHGPAMLTNLVRLGLVEVTYSQFIPDESAYAFAKNRPEYFEALQRVKKDGEKISVDQGVIRRTPLGERFANAVGIETLDAATAK